MLAEDIYMKRAVDLALLGIGSVSPNPMVGSVIVFDNKIIGEGYHQKYGEAHAEVNAIQSVLENHKNGSELLRKSTLYVTLEPCSHHGKTPPCSDLIIRHKIPKVVIGSVDPFDSVNGKGIEKLKNAGIEVISGVLEKECQELNKRFFTRVKHQRPYVILKWAQTKNHFFAPVNNQQLWITGKEAKLLVHQWRTEEDCVLVGKNTALVDNPQLNVRLVKGRNPKRAVIDRNLDLPQNLHLFDNSTETFVFNKFKTAIERNTKHIAIEDFDYFLPQYILLQLHLQDIQSVIIEGGAKTLAMFIDNNLWDEARVFTSSNEWENGIPAPKIDGKTISTQNLGNDTLHILKNINSL